MPAAVSLSRSPGFAQAGGAPDLVALGERPGDREGDLPGGAGDEDLLAVEQPHLSLPRRRHRLCEVLDMFLSDVRAACAGVHTSEEGVVQLTFDAEVEAFRAEFIAFLDETPAQPRRRRRSGPGPVRTCRSGPGAGSDCSSITAGCCRAIRRSSAAATPASSSSSCTARNCRGGRSTHLQPAGRGDHRGVAAVLRHRASRSNSGRCRSCAPR